MPKLDAACIIYMIMMLLNGGLDRLSGRELEFTNKKR
jgi:hypothetical protein